MYSFETITQNCNWIAVHLQDGKKVIMPTTDIRRITEVKEGSVIRTMDSDEITVKGSPDQILDAMCDEHEEKSDGSSA